MEATDVAIVGGGPGGIAAASALSKAGLSVKVFERMPELYPVGAAIGLGPNGMNCLEALGDEVYEAVSEVCSTGLHKTRIFSKEGQLKPTSGTDIGDFYEIARQYGPEGSQGLVTVKWHKLRDTLAKKLPEGILELGVSFSDFSEDKDGVTLNFHDRQPLRAKVLIGADGANSAVRTQALGEKKPPFQGVVVWRGIVNEETIKGAIKPGDDGISSHMWTEGARFGGILRLPGKKSREVVWMCISPWATEREQEIRKAAHGTETKADQAAKLERCLEAMGDFDESFLSIVRATDPSTVQQNPIYRRMPSVSWGHGRVSLLGDAAHLMPPNYGQGTSLALEDALALADVLSKNGIDASSLRMYEGQRMGRVLPIQVTIGLEAHRSWKGAGAEGLIKEGSMSEHMKQFMHHLFSYKPAPLHTYQAWAYKSTCHDHRLPCHSIASAVYHRYAQVSAAVAVAPMIIAHSLGNW